MRRSAQFDVRWFDAWKPDLDAASATSSCLDLPARAVPRDSGAFHAAANESRSSRPNAPRSPFAALRKGGPLL